MSNTRNTGKPEAMKINRTDIDEGLNSMFPATPEPTQTKDRNATKDGRRQVTYKLPVSMIEKVKALAYWSRREQWQIVKRAIEKELKAYEEANGTIEPIPEED